MNIVKNRSAIIGLAALAVGALSTVVAVHGCGVTQPHKTYVPVGTTLTLKPVESRAALAPQVAQDYPNVHLVINYEGQILGPQSDAEVWVYESPTAKEPVYKLATKDLVTMYQDTKCSPQLITHLNNALKGDGLFCNHYLDLSKMHYFVLKIPGHPDEIATSLLIEYHDPVDKVLSVAIPFT